MTVDASQQVDTPISKELDEVFAWKQRYYSSKSQYIELRYRKDITASEQAEAKELLRLCLTSAQWLLNRIRTSDKKKQEELIKYLIHFTYEDDPKELIKKLSEVENLFGPYIDNWNPEEVGLMFI